MKKCPVCLDGRILTKISSAGEESFCVDCRKIVASASLGFKFAVTDTEEGISECRGPEGDPRPGLKGPGKKAKCWLYDEGDEESRSAAERKARNSAYSFQHKRSASRIINATPGFTGAPAALTPPAPTPSTPAGAAPATPGTTGIDNRGPGASQDFSQTMPPTAADGSVAPQNSIGEATAPGGIQPGNLNSNNPMNSATTSSKRLAELIQEYDMKNYMGPSFCPEHKIYDGCNPDRNLQ
jgi:hypothetical protein